MFIAISDFTDTLSFLCCSGIQINKNNCTVELWVQVINLAVEFIFVQYLILTAEGGMLQNSTATSPSMNCHLIMMEGFVCTHDPRSYVVECNLPLVWSPKANWSCLRGQTKSDSQDEGKTNKKGHGYPGIGLLGSHPGVNRWLGVKFGRKGAIHRQ